MEGIEGIGSSAMQLVTSFIKAMKDRETRKRFNELLKMIEEDLKAMRSDDLTHSCKSALFGVMRAPHSDQYYVYDRHLLKTLNTLRGILGLKQIGEYEWGGH